MPHFCFCFWLSRIEKKLENICKGLLNFSEFEEGREDSEYSVKDEKATFL